ncbi:SAM-dependent methyltransferase, partial [Candidatus Woesearchaeota archaeon CG_4_10_14_0_8_um_filter_47_5]
KFLPYSTKSRLPKWPLFVRIYLALPLLQDIFGKQMFIVAQKP